MGWPKVCFCFCFFFSIWKNSSELFNQLNSSSKCRCQSLLDQHSLQKCNKGSQSIFSTCEAWNTRSRKAFFLWLKATSRIYIWCHVTFWYLYLVVCCFFPHLTEGQVGSNSDDLIILSDGLWISKEHVSWLHIKFSLPSIQEKKNPKTYFLLCPVKNVE